MTHRGNPERPEHKERAIGATPMRSRTLMMQPQRENAKEPEVSRRFEHGNFVGSCKTTQNKNLYLCWRIFANTADLGGFTKLRKLDVGGNNI